MSARKKIFVVDDHPIMRLGYKYLLNREDEFEVCGEASSVAEALSGIALHSPDLVIADISLEGTSGIELVKQLHSNEPDLCVVVVSMHDESLFAERALRAGARAYLMKSEVESRLVTAIRTVLDGGFFLSQRMNAQILAGFARGDRMTSTSSLGKLTDRELQVFEMQGHGKSTREIGDAMHISPKTVETYRRRIKEKLSLDSTAALTHRAIEWLQSEKQDGD